ncbi:MAG: hypothetical protein ACRDP5_17700 [Streptosporangiaceae bacterium]
MSGHGHVTPNPDGTKARCGGPGLCSECSQEAALAPLRAQIGTSPLNAESEHTTMRQVAPYPQELADLVAKLSYRVDRGWRVWLEDNLQRDKPGRHSGESRGMTLVVQRCGPDTYHPDNVIAVNHYFPVPPATFNRQSWRRWLFDRLGDVDDHERCEDFIIDGRRPFAPNHGPGWNPYLITELATDEDRRTSFRGELNPESP